MNYVLSDVHGNKRRFDSVMAKIQLRPEDHLYILGDVIDRHPHGIELLQRIIGAENISMLLGNHEYMMLNAVTLEEEPLPWKRPTLCGDYCTWFRNGGERTLNAFLQLSGPEQRELREYLKGLPLSLDISVSGLGYKLVHAAPPELYPWHCRRYGVEYPDAAAFALWHRFEVFDPIPEGWVVIFGHTPTLYFQPEKVLSVWYGEGAIGIDCGSGFRDGPTTYNPFQGRLCCLRLEDMQAFYSEEQGG